MADLRLTTIGSYDTIVKALALGKLKPDTYIYVKDREVLAWVDKYSNLHLLGDSVQRINSFEDITKPSIYVLYIKDNRPYIYNGEEFQPIYNEITSYNQLDDTPMINKNGTTDAPIIINDLPDGNYMITGVFVLPNEERVVTLTGNYFVIVTTADIKHINRIYAGQLSRITVDLENSSSTFEEYITDAYLKKHGYITSDVLEETVSELVEHELEECLVTISDEEIEDIFDNKDKFEYEEYQLKDIQS